MSTARKIDRKSNRESTKNPSKIVENRPKIGPKTGPGRLRDPRRPPGALQERKRASPNAPGDAPGAPQSAPGSPREPPRAALERPKTPKTRAGGRPGGPRAASERLFRATSLAILVRTTFRTNFGRFAYQKRCAIQARILLARASKATKISAFGKRVDLPKS